MAEKDIYIKNYLYPEAKKLFKCTLKTIDEIKEECVYVVDTNALLLPYTISNKSLLEIERIFSNLIKENKIFIPGQVAREFVNRRPDKVKEILSKLISKQNKTTSLFGINTNYPLLEPLNGQPELLELEKTISEQLKLYNSHLNNVIKQIKSWTWNDPISKIYSNLFEEDTVIEFVHTEEDTRDFRKRSEHKIAPGYKDGSKSDDGIGDYLIWKTILKLGKEKKCSIIFISGEEKPDWWYRSEKERIFPRFELIQEFERECQQSFHIMKLSELVEMFGAEEDIIEEIKLEEKPGERLYTDESNSAGPDTSLM